jgi:hypothetical protein
MNELWNSLTDDQVALLGCAAALFVTGTMMSLSYYIGRSRLATPGQKPSESHTRPSQPLRLQPTASAVATERRDAA